MGQDLFILRNMTSVRELLENAVFEIFVHLNITFRDNNLGYIDSRACPLRYRLVYCHIHIHILPLEHVPNVSM